MPNGSLALPTAAVAAGGVKVPAAIGAAWYHSTPAAPRDEVRAI